MLGADEVLSPEGRITDGTCLAGRTAVVEGLTLTETPVVGGDQQCAFFADGLLEAVEQDVGIEMLAMLLALHEQIRDVGRQQDHVAPLYSYLRGNLLITDVCCHSYDLVGGTSAVDDDVLSGDPSGFVRQEETDEVRDVLTVAYA